LRRELAVSAERGDEAGPCTKMFGWHPGELKKGTLQSGSIPDETHISKLSSLTLERMISFNPQF